MTPSELHTRKTKRRLSPVAGSKVRSWAVDTFVTWTRPTRLRLLGDRHRKVAGVGADDGEGPRIGGEGRGLACVQEVAADRVLEESQRAAADATGLD